MRYALFIIPPEPVYSELDKIIKDLSIKYKGPVFIPHVTVLSGISGKIEDIEKSVEKVTSNYNEILLTLESISFSTTYFQSVFVRVNSNVKLMQLNLAFKKVFNFENNVFMPHISLIYGNHSMDVREKISEDVKLRSTSFSANQIAIIKLIPNSTIFKPLITFPLNGSF
jgi:2'-5' RNA ligase